MFHICLYVIIPRPQYMHVYKKLKHPTQRFLYTNTRTIGKMENSLLTETAEERLYPHNIFIDMINIQKQKETNNDIWKNSPYKDLVKLQSNNVGNVGETFLQKLCDLTGIHATVDGSKTKQLGGGNGDGTINGKCVEIKTSHRGCAYPNFQHELGETPWKPDYMVFIDISPESIYLTIFPNYSEEFYKSGKKCDPYFPTKSVTWRKGTGAFKLDTSVKINEENVANGYTLKIQETTVLEETRNYIIRVIPIETPMDTPIETPSETSITPPSVEDSTQEDHHP